MRGMVGRGGAPRRVRCRAVAVAVAMAVLGGVAPAAAAANGTTPGQPAVSDPASLVDPLTGTASGGNTFPGATVPFGMVQLSPDTGYAEGYSYANGSIRGFSETHLSGAGCAQYGDIPFMPTTGAVTSTNPATYASPFSHSRESASPGSYAVDLDRYGVHAELTAGERTGWHRYTFPSTSQANVLINVGESLSSETAAHIDVVGDDTVEGSVTSGQFCAGHNTYTLYFSARFDRPFTSFGTWKGSTVTPGSRTEDDPNAGGYVTFDTTGNRTVQAQVGISFVSVDGARRNRAADTAGTDFDGARARAHAAWNRALSAIDVQGGTADQQRTFYTALYHAQIAPNVFNDVDGRYPGFDGRIHTVHGRSQYANFSLWDTYRTEEQLLDLVAPDRARDMLASLLADGRQGGALPKWPVANGESNVMSGDPVTPLLADGFAKGLLRGRERDAFSQLWRNANQLPSADTPFEGRWGVDFYRQHGYVPYAPDLPDKGSSNDAVLGGSITLEYALADASLAPMAAALGHRTEALELQQRGRNYRNLWDTGTGFLRPRLTDGTWMSPFDPLNGNNVGYHEGSAWHYLWLVPQDADGLIGLLGGRAATEQRLDDFFAYPQLLADPHGTADTVWCRPPSNRCSSARYNPNNEPNLGSPYMYLWTGRPDKTATVVRAAQSLFGTGPNGITGNDDLGTMSSWYVLSSLGLYPIVPGTSLYGLTTPMFDRAVVHLRRPYYSSDRLVIEAPGSSMTRRYVRSAWLNGRPFNRTWLTHDTVRRGAVLRFDLTDQAPDGRQDAWGTGHGAAPPSISEHPAIPQRHLEVGVHPGGGLFAASGRTTAEQFAVTVTGTFPGRAAGSLEVRAPAGWTVTPARRPLRFDTGEDVPDAQDMTFDVTVPADAPIGRQELDFVATAGGVQSETRVPVQVVSATCAYAAAGWCPVDLSPFTTNDGVAFASDPSDGHFDNSGWNYPGEQLPSAGPVTLLGTPFAFPSTADGADNVVQALGQTLPLPAGHYSEIDLLGASHNGAASGTGTVTYADGTSQPVTVGFSDWAKPPAAGEQIAIHSTYRYKSGTAGPQTPPVSIFMRSVAVDPSRELRSITLPDSSKVSLFGASLKSAG